MSASSKPVLLICDMQTGYRHSVYRFNLVEKSICILLDIVKPFEIPAIITNQNTGKFGTCIPCIKQRMPADARIFEKYTFSMLTDEVVGFLKSEHRDQVVVVGIEAHICVSQTAFELQRHGYKVVVLADAVSSTSSQERKLALKRMRDAGISVNSVEGWIFELLRSDNHPVYDRTSALLRETRRIRSHIVKALL